MRLSGRLKRLERLVKPASRYEVHVHDLCGRPDADPREVCRLCKAMTDDEYEAWLAWKPPAGVTKVIDVIGPDGYYLGEYNDDLYNPKPEDFLNE